MTINRARVDIDYAPVMPGFSLQAFAIGQRHVPDLTMQQLLTARTSNP